MASLSSSVKIKLDETVTDTRVTQCHSGECIYYSEIDEKCIRKHISIDKGKCVYYANKESFTVEEIKKHIEYQRKPDIYVVDGGGNKENPKMVGKRYQ